MSVISNVLSAATTTPPAGPGPNAELNSNDFIQLLIAQLRSQDPLDPTKPEEFLGQLVQFNTLDQLIEIRKLLTPQPQQTAGVAPAANLTGKIAGNQ